MANPSPILTQLTSMTITDDGGDPVIVGGVMSIKGIGSGKAKEIDVTTLASTATEFVQGLRDFGSATVELLRNQDDVGQLEMFMANSLQSTREFVVTLPTSTANVITFKGFITSISTEIDKDGAVMGTASIRITGAIAFT